MEQVFAIRAFNLNTVTWTPITVPITCSRVVIENPSSTNTIAIRTDPAEGNPSKTIPVSAELNLTSSVEAFAAGTTICWARASAGSGPAVVTYTR